MEAAALGVEYVYVGRLERALYDPAGLAKFDALMRSGQIQQVYSADDTRIYQIPRETAPAPALLTTSAVRAPTLPPEKNLLLDTPVYVLPALNDYDMESPGRFPAGRGCSGCWPAALLALGLPWRCWCLAARPAPATPGPG